MTLTLELPPELETQLNEAAARSGQAPETFATAALAATLRDVLANHTTIHGATHGGSNGTPRLTMAEFDAALDELAAIGADIPALDESITHSREDIYCDHD